MHLSLKAVSDVLDHSDYILFCLYFIIKLYFGIYDELVHYSI